MALRADHSTLPKSAPEAGGAKPDRSPRFVHLLAAAWAAARQEEGPKERAFPDSRFRHSDAGGCSRAIGYAALDLPASDDMDLSGWWNTGLGTIVHEAWQEALRARYPDAEIEPKVRTAAGSGHIDAVIRQSITTGDEVRLDAPWTIAVELKTIGGFGFKMAVGERGEAQGPKHEHVVQAALNGLAVDADEVVIAYLSKEAISVAAAQRKGLDEIARFAAEWTFPRDQYEPIATAEVNRITAILGLLDQGTLPARKIPSPEVPPGAEIVDPSTGRWEVRSERGIEDVGSWWGCGYCRYQTLCAGTPPGRIPVAEVRS